MKETKEICPQCGSTGWIIIERNGVSGAERCPCRLQSAAAEIATPLTEASAYILTNVLCELLNFAPEADGAKVFVANALLDMCHSQEQAEWLIKETANLYTKWPGIRGLRQVFCSRHKPKDGIMVTYTDAFPDGILPAKLPEPQQLRLPTGHVATADTELEAAVKSTVKAKSLPPSPPRNPITQEDVARAVAELRRKKTEVVAR